MSMWLFLLVHKANSISRSWGVKTQPYLILTADDKKLCSAYGRENNCSAFRGSLPLLNGGCSYRIDGERELSKHKERNGELLALKRPRPSFCWSPAIQGSGTPISSLSSYLIVLLSIRVRVKSSGSPTNEAAKGEEAWQMEGRGTGGWGMPKKERENGGATAGDSFPFPEQEGKKRIFLSHPIIPRILFPAVAEIRKERESYERIAFICLSLFIFLGH
eukprot:gene9802-6879_t